MQELRKVPENAEFKDLIQIAIFLGYLNSNRVEISKKYLRKKNLLIEEIDLDIRWYAKTTEEKIFDYRKHDYPYSEVVNNILRKIGIELKIGSIEEKENKLIEYLKSQLSSQEIYDLKSTYKLISQNQLNEIGKM